MTTKDEKDDGAKSFAVLLPQIDDGALHAEATEELRKLLVTLSTTARNRMLISRGEMALKMKFAVTPKGEVTVIGEVTTKAPKGKNPTSTFFLTPGSTLSQRNPRQQELPLRDVSNRDRSKDLSEDDLEARSL